MKDCYAILEILPTASQEAIREQYYFLIQAWHPDKFRNPDQKAKAEEKSKEVNIAYSVLKDPQKRAKYDRGRRGQPSPSGEEERRRAEEQRRRKQGEEAQQRAASEGQQRERAEEERRRTNHEAKEAAKKEEICLAFEHARRRQSKQPPAEVKNGHQDPIRILIVDDVADTRMHIRKLLSVEADIRVVGEASNGVEAIEQFSALGPDVMTTCVHMPIMDGFSATEAICRRHPWAKVIIISVQDSTNYIRRAVVAGACDYLIKPPAVGELQSAIRRATGREMFTSEKDATK